MNNNNKYILFIGMGDWYLPQLKIAKDKGYKTIVTNRESNAQALKEADIPIVCDGLDIYGIISSIIEKNISSDIEYIYSGTELFTTTALIAKWLGIPWHSPTSAYTCEKKHLLKNAFLNNAIPIAKGIEVKSLSELEFKMESLINVNQLIVKPSDSLSAQGVTILKNIEDLHSAFNYAMGFSSSKNIIVEEYIEGSLHDVNGIITENEFFPLGINDKTAGPLPFAVVTRGSAPTSLTPTQQQNLYDLFVESCRVIGLGPGPVKGDFIMDRKGKFYTMEISARLHGPLGTLHLIPNSLGINPFQELLHYTQNEKVNTHDIHKTDYLSIITEASDKKQKNDSSDIIAYLEKSGIYDRSQWKSNYDVPIYVVKRI